MDELILGKSYEQLKEKWDSLLVPISGEVIATYTTGREFATLETYGDILISGPGNICYDNISLANGALREEIISGKIDNHEYDIIYNNYFELSVYKNEEEIIESFTFDDEPGNKKELSDLMSSYLYHCVPLPKAMMSI